jgi:hypothetical protein
MRDHSLRTDKPLIYHLDIAAMYSNIMLSSPARSLMRPRPRLRLQVAGQDV